jgi:glycine cleavage system aminomethyltransferase T
VLREHLHTRNSAGLFDVSHMGQIALRAKSGRVEDAAQALERLVPQDILNGCARAGSATPSLPIDSGGILDDLMVGQFRQPSVPGGERRLQGRGRGASARAPCRTAASSSRCPTAR